MALTPVPMSQIHRNPFLELVAQSFASLPREAIYAEFLAKFHSIAGGVDFDLFLWSLAHRLKVDTEELLRQLGERWIAERIQKGSFPLSPDEGALCGLSRLLSRGEALAAAPVPGMQEFQVTLLLRKEDSLRVACHGARRCSSFIEGAARELAARNGESIRYLRQPKRGGEVEILFSCFSQ